MTAVEVSLVIPAFNAAGYLGDTVERILSSFDQGGIDGEVVVADDGSTDGTADAVPASDRVRIVRLPHGGKGAAVRAGMAVTRGEICGFTDADLPYGLEPLPLAMAYIRDRHYHAVIGDRTLPGSTYAGTGLLRTVVSNLASLSFRTLVTGGIYDTQCGFKVFRGDVGREVFRLSRIRGFAIDVEIIALLLKYRLDIKRIPVRLERNAPSSVRVVRDSIRAFRDIATIRWNWSTGRYRAPLLVGLLEDELRRDVAAASGPVRSGPNSPDPPPPAPPPPAPPPPPPPPSIDRSG